MGYIVHLKCPVGTGNLHLRFKSLFLFNDTTRRKEGNVLFNDALNTFYLWLYGVGHMVKDHSDSEIGNPLPPHGLLLPISIKGSFMEGRKEGNVLFNDALNTFYFTVIWRRTYGKGPFR